MKELIYDQEHGKRWANFSGDYNPIHFDLTAAAELAQKDLIVHGMRVIADVKKHLFFQSKNTKYQQPVPIRLSAKFEKPVLCGIEYSLACNINNKKTSYKLVDSSTGSVCIRGSLYQALPPEIDNIITEKIATQKYLNEVIQHWPAEIEQDYVIFLSLIMFRELFNIPVLFHVNFLHGRPPVHSLAALLAQEKVIQTHYDLYCNTSLLYIKERSIEDMIIRTGTPLITGDNDYGWLIQVQIAVEDHRTTVMQISVTLKITSD